MKTRVKRESVLGEAEIDLTSLIDCIFLLLIFFMVTILFIHVKGLVVDLPGAADTSEEQQQKKDVNIVISMSGEFSVAGESVSATGLPMAIRGKMDEFNNRTVIIQGDPEAEHRYVIYAMDMAQGQGAEQMAFAIEEKEEEQ